MKKILRKSFRKRIAILLMAVLLIPLLPILPVFAQAEIPDFPYLSQYWYDTNTDSFALWEVHGSNKVSYVQTRTNVFPDGAFPVVYRSGLSWTGYYYYIDYSKITDTWTKAGNHVDGGYSWTANIRVPAPGETTVNSDVYATLVYCNTDIYHGNGAGDNDIYAYQNFIVPSYTDPTPTPEPIEPGVIVMYGDYLPFQLGDIPNYGSDIYANGFTATGEVINIANALPGHQPTYASIFAGVCRDNYNRALFGIYITDSDTFDNPLTGFAFDHRVYGPYTSVDGTVTKYVHYFIRSNAYDWAVYGKPNLNNVNVPTCYWEDSSLHKVQSLYYPYLAGYGYCDFYGFNGQSNPNVSPTPTPTVAPTAIPQPSISPVPTEPPDSGEDNNWTGLFGWLKRIRDSILNIPKKIVSGILDAFKYIFLPDPDKVKGVFNTLNNKFGIEHPTKFTVDPNELFRPANVVWQFRPISLNGEETEAVDVTIINFEEVDEWLDSSPGMVITRILQAMFGITMFAYLIYIFTKHIATINYTDAHTLMHLDDPPQNQKGGSR